MADRFLNRLELDEYLSTIPMFKDVGMEASNYSLNTIRDFCETIGSPHKQFKSIHVAGTNGKGTTAYFISETLNKAGVKCGLYTSPHLIDYAERVQINGKWISNKDLLQFFNQFHASIEEYKLSYFEISTALAFWYFAEKKVEIAVIEAGLGGRLDATNIIEPMLSVITSISYDHMDVLGHTLEQIAREKAGIIKEGGAVLVGHLPQNIHALIRDIANQKRASFHNIEHLHPSYETSIKLFDRGHWHDLGNHFTEKVNRYNYALAWQSLTLIRHEYPIQIDQKAEIMRNIPPIMGRFEKLNEHDWFFSGSHNPTSLDSVKQTLEDVYPFRKPVIICAVMKDKFNDAFVSFIRNYEKVYFFPLESERALTYEAFSNELPGTELFKQNGEESLLSEMKDELVIFVGSFYFYQTVKGLVDKENS